MSRGVEGFPCARCGDLEARFRDAATPNPGAFLYAWATHHLDDHAAEPKPREECAECQRFTVNAVGVRARVWERWALTHWMACRLAPEWEWQKGH